MDDENELAKAKWVLIFGIFFLVTTYFAINEMRYITFARQSDGVVTGVKATVAIGRRGRRIPKLQVDFQFTDQSGTLKAGKQELSPDADVPTVGGIRVEYLAGVEGSARILRPGSSTWPIGCFAAAVFALGFFIIKLAREANAPIKTTRKRR